MGSVCFSTRTVPSSRSLVIVQTTSASCSTGTCSDARSWPGVVWGDGLPAVDAHDLLRVPVEVRADRSGARGLRHRVGAGVVAQLAGGAAVAGVLLLGVAADAQVERVVPGVADDVLDDSSLPCSRSLVIVHTMSSPCSTSTSSEASSSADVVFATSSWPSRQTISSGSRRGSCRPGRAGALGDGVGPRVVGQLGGRVAVSGVLLADDAFDLQVERVAVGVALDVLDDLELAALTLVGDRADDVAVVGDGDAQRREVLPGVVLATSVWPFRQTIFFW
jgi:hypothetical protein